MSLNLILTMGAISAGSSMIEAILGKIGKIEESKMVGIVSTSMLITTVVTCILKAFTEIKRLG